MATLTKNGIHPRVAILNHLKEIRRPLKWIADVTDIPYGSVYSIFTHKTMELTQERLDKINAGLGTSFKFPSSNNIHKSK